MSTKQVSTKLYPDDMELLEDYQEQHGVSRSEAVRRLVREGADRPGLVEYGIIIATGLVLIGAGSYGAVPYIWSQFWAVSVLVWLTIGAVTNR
jgi:Ribbon-helix-helix protein, copG family.